MFHRTLTTCTSADLIKYLCRSIFQISISLISAPPSTIEIQGYQHNSKVEVRENQDLTLTCIVSDAKPAAQIQWFRSNVEYKPGKFCLFVIGLTAKVYN